MKATEYGAVLLSLTLGLAVGAAPAGAQHIIGGGDPLMMIFSEAKYEAHRILENFRPEVLPTGAGTVRTWLEETVLYHGQTLPRFKAMALEMARSTHAWKEGDVGFDKCAVIRLDPNEEPAIELSLTRCRTALALSPSGGAEALKTLLHEISHRFGLTTSDVDEEKASAVAVAVFNAWRIERQGTAPFWTGTQEMLTPRTMPSAVWTGAGNEPTSNQLLVWGGCDENPTAGYDACKHYLSSGGRLVYKREGPLGEPPETTWLPMTEVDAPAGRKLHTALWTGETKVAAAKNKMIVFGGCRGDDTACNQSLAVTPNSLYDATNDKWTMLESAGAPTPRVYHSAVWTTQDEMIVWGGLEGNDDVNHDRILGDGGILSFPEGKPEGEWRPLLAGNGAPAARYGHTGIWTGTELVVWGGCGQEPGITRCMKPLNDGAFYDPFPANGTPHWRELKGDSVVQPRVKHSAIWTGRYLIVWGGKNGARTLANGARWDAADNTWKVLNPTLPRGETGRSDHVAVYEPLQGRMVIWGGVAADGEYPSRTLIYDIENNHWKYAGTDTDPVGRQGHVATWIQDSLFVWGGYNRDNGFLSQGGIFNP